NLRVLDNLKNNIDRNRDSKVNPNKPKDNTNRKMKKRELINEELTHFMSVDQHYYERSCLLLVDLIKHLIETPIVIFCYSQSVKNMDNLGCHLSVNVTF